MKPTSKYSEEESKRIFWVIQTIFGFIIARSFFIYGEAFMKERGQIFVIDKLIICSLICLNFLLSLRFDFNLAFRRVRLWLTVL